MVALDGAPRGGRVRGMDVSDPSTRVVRAVAAQINADPAIREAFPDGAQAISREPFEADLGGEAAEKMGATTGWWIVVSASVDEAVGVFTLAPSPPPTVPT